MEYLTRDQIARPTAGMSQRLRFRQVRLFPSQLLGQEFMRCDIDCCAVVALKYPIFNDRNTHTTNVTNLPVRPKYSARDIATTVLLMHPLYCFSKRVAILGVDRSKELLKGWSSLCRVKAEYLVNFVGPIDI